MPLVEKQALEVSPVFVAVGLGEGAFVEMVGGGVFDVVRVVPAVLLGGRLGAEPGDVVLHGWTIPKVVSQADATGSCAGVSMN